MSEKRKRGANYTSEDKTLLADLITQFRHVVEDKKTSIGAINKKKQIWKVITNKYNSSCTSGRRETEQLKALYDNMKQKSRKSVAEKNKLEYINSQITERQDENIPITEIDLTNALNNLKDDKVQIYKTGGGYFKSKSTDSEAKILAVIQNQVEPQANPYDSASTYFKDKNLDVNVESNIIPIPYQFISNIEPSSTNTQPSSTITQPSSTITQLSSTITQPSSTITQLSSTKKKKKGVNKISSADSLKCLYFKKKCQNAYLEKKKLLQEMLYMKQEHNLKMAILKKKLNKN